MEGIQMTTPNENGPPNAKDDEKKVWGYTARRRQKDYIECLSHACQHLMVMSYDAPEIERAAYKEQLEELERIKENAQRAAARIWVYAKGA